MTDSNDPVEVTNVPSSIFAEFLESLEKRQVDPMLIARLRTELVEKRAFSEIALREAMFPLLDQL